MFAQESVMDIQKEREAFEKHASKFFTTNEAFEDDGENYVYDEVKFMWDCWLAAKAQAVPEGFVVVAKELPEKIAEKMAIDRIDKPAHENDPVWSEIAEESYKNQVKLKKWGFWRDYKAMIEAQEPTND